MNRTVAFGSKLVLALVALCVFGIATTSNGMSSYPIHNPESETISCTALASDVDGDHDLIGLKCDKGSKDFMDIKQMVLVTEKSMCLIADIRDTHPEYEFVALFCESGTSKNVKFGAPAFIKSNISGNGMININKNSHKI